MYLFKQDSTVGSPERISHKNKILKMERNISTIKYAVSKAHLAICKTASGGLDIYELVCAPYVSPFDVHGVQGEVPAHELHTHLTGNRCRHVPKLHRHVLTLACNHTCVG